MTTRHPAAYLRRSYVDPDSPGDISKDAQRTAVSRLAAADGYNGSLVEYDDWGISADVAKSAKRTDYTRLLTDMEAGSIAAVYAFDTDRLYRDPRDLIRLQDAAQRHQVRIVTTAGALAIGEGDDPTAEGFAFISAVFGRMELQKSKKRARAGREARRKRGDAFGHPGLGFRHVKAENDRIVLVRDEDVDLEPIREAYIEAGSVLGAVKLLNARGIPSPKGKTWHTSALTRTMQRHWPELLPAKGASGKRIPAASILSQLVRCGRCGHVMTPNTHRRQLYCSHGAVTPDHGRKTVQEAALLPWIKAEAARVKAYGTVAIASHNAGLRAELEAERERLGWDVVRGLLSPEAIKARAAEIDAELERLNDADLAVEVPANPIDWEHWAPADINDVLRHLWRFVRLDDQMRPVEAVWIEPRMRTE